MFEISHDTKNFFKIIDWKKEAIKGHVHTIHSLWIMYSVAQNNNNKLDGNSLAVQWLGLGGFTSGASPPEEASIKISAEGVCGASR